MHDTSFYIANSSGSLTTVIPKLRSAYDKVKTVIPQLINLDLSSVDIIIVDDPYMTIETIGVGGYSPNRHLCYVYLDSSKDLSEDEIFYTLCHELAHIRRYDGPGFGTTLFDSMIFEGLATAFEDEVSKGSSHLVQLLASRTETQQLIDHYADQLDTTDFNHQEWFISGKKDELPEWAGYEIGYYIVRQYLKDANKKASELALEGADQFRKLGTFLRKT